MGAPTSGSVAVEVMGPAPIKGVDIVLPPRSPPGLRQSLPQ
jgi:hypothetical protein